MTESYRAHYLLTSLAVVKKNMFDHDRYVGPGSSPSEFKRQIIKINTTTRDMWTRIATQI